MNRVMFIAYHDAKPVYSQCANQLAESMDLAGVTDFNLEKYSATWDFNQACAFKPSYISDCMIKFNDYDSLVYLDVDAIVVRRPSLFYEIGDEYDLGVHYKDGKELLSGTIWLRNNAKVFDLMAEWSARCQDNQRIWDQKVLQELLKEKQDINVFQLPPQYCQIFDLMKNGTPVIKHMQASRLSRGIDPNHSPIQDRMLWTQ